jgi:hypothetical protein
MLSCTPTAKRGVMTIEFRDLALKFDLSAGTFTAAVGGQTKITSPCSIMERTSNTIDLLWSEDSRTITVTLNAQVLAAPLATGAGTSLAIGAGGGGVIQVDEVTLARTAAVPAGASPAPRR